MFRIRKDTFRLLPLFLLCAGLIAYFSYHAVHGKHGLRAKAALQARVEALENDLNTLRTERERIERKTARMNGPARDEDLIEEQARTVLNFAHPDDIVLIKPAPRQP